jgi:predicted Ser/Thr protein kinase
MSVNWSQYSLEQLRAHATQTFREGGGSRPDVLLIEIDGHYAVLKDQSAADRMFALLIGPILNWRECKALSKLSNVSCVPNLLSKPTSRSFLMTYHRSEQLTRLQDFEPKWPDFFEKLSAAIDQIHQAGVAHNDLRNPTNTLITPNGDPILVDLVACYCKGQAWNLPNQWMFTKFSQVDLSAITKMKSIVAKELITDSDIVAEDIAGSSGMAIKALGQWVRRISRRLFTQ